MGWCSGTQIFDAVVKDILKFDELELKNKKKLIKDLVVTLEDMDWDCQCESQYADDPLVKTIFRQLHPNWYTDEE